MIRRTLATLAGGVFLAILALADPATGSVFPPCLWRSATGWLCPGCGSARAIHALLHGQLLSALYLNPLAVVAMPVVASDVVQGWRDTGDGWMRRLRPAYIWGLAVIIVLFGVLRNLPSENSAR